MTSWILLALFKTCHRNRHVYYNRLTDPKRHAVMPLFITTWSKDGRYLHWTMSTASFTNTTGDYKHVGIKMPLKWILLEGELALAYMFCQSHLSLSVARDCALAALKRIKNIDARNKLQMSRVVVHRWQSTAWVLPQATPTQLKKSGISFDQTNSWNSAGTSTPWHSTHFKCSNT